MSGYEREINWNLSGKTHSEVQKEHRIKELEQQRDELLAALERLLPQYTALLNDCDLSSDDTLAQSRAAIAKVKP